VVAAVIGAAFVIGLQIAAILSTDTLSRTSVLRSERLVALAPDPDSIVWWPARAILGDGPALMAVLAASLALLAAAILMVSRSFADHVMAAASVAHEGPRRAARAHTFRSASPRRVLRQKEWTLLLRDPWLVSQSLMQMLYLLPPALLLWKSWGDDDGALVLVVPVLVMAAGQLAGGLAWLLISGEDAPDLVATAPITARRILAAKIEAVIGMIALIFAPIVGVLVLDEVFAGFVCGLGILSAAAAATMIQLCFRVQARRSQFRRRQTSSRIATFAEAFSSIAWASTSALAAAGAWHALGPAVIAFGILGGVWLMRPSRF